MIPIELSFIDDPQDPRLRRTIAREVVELVALFPSITKCTVSIKQTPSPIREKASPYRVAIELSLPLQQKSRFEFRSQGDTLEVFIRDAFDLLARRLHRQMVRSRLYESSVLGV